MKHKTSLKKGNYSPSNQLKNASQCSFLVYKPFGMLSQFTQEVEGQLTLADLDFSFPIDVYPVGRLDYDSEGLLLLSNDKSLTDKLLNPINEHNREYWVQVEGEITDEALCKLNNGVEINIKGKKYTTKPAQVQKIAPPVLPERNPPIRTRKMIPTSWVSIVLKEGKNRQVRRMTAATGFPTLRLVRARILNLTLEGLKSGSISEISLTKLQF